MAVSNAVGSNVFDILICLGLPWFIQTTIIDTGGHVNVISKGNCIWLQSEIIVIVNCLNQNQYNVKCCNLINISLPVFNLGLTYSTLSLLSTVVFLLLSVHLNGWKLDRRLGIILMIWYLLFITIASMYELNVFGTLNPRECNTDY